MCRIALVRHAAAYPLLKYKCPIDVLTHWVIDQWMPLLEWFITNRNNELDIYGKLWDCLLYFSNYMWSEREKDQSMHWLDICIHLHMDTDNAHYTHYAIRITNIKIYVHMDRLLYCLGTLKRGDIIWFYRCSYSVYDL